MSRFADGREPDIKFTVNVNHRIVPVEVFITDSTGFPGNQGVTYIMVQADIFRDRKRATIYSFEDESEMVGNR